MTSPRIVSLDIETYGFCERDRRGRTLPEQTVFHPSKSVHTDGCPVDSLVQTVQLTIPEADPRPEPSRPWNMHLLAGLRPWRTFVLDPSSPKDVRTLCRWLLHADTIVGSNIQFDVLYLRHAIPAASAILRRRLHTLVDTMVLAFLECEARPERSLKDLCRLRGLAKWGETLRDRRFPSPTDAAALAYAADDPHATLVLAADLAASIVRDQSDTPKTLPTVLSHYSNSIWTAVELAEVGIPYSVSRLRRLQSSLETSLGVAESMARARGLLLSGPGSDASKRALASSAASAVQPFLGPEESVGLTPKKKEVQWSDANRALFLKHLPPAHPSCLALRWGDVHASRQKLLSTYVYPLLHHKRNDPSNKGSRLCPYPSNPDVGLAHPSWFVVPSLVKGGKGFEGGTIQVRMTCKGPAAQTDPPVIQGCRRSRHLDGTLASIDLSQIELRVPAVLSGEPSLVDAFERDLDLHTDRALRMFGSDILDDPLFKEVYRQAGKTVNFADAFWASDHTMQQQVYERTGRLIPLEFFSLAVADRPRLRPVLWRWQNALVESARRNHRIVLPIVGATRPFPGRIDAHVNEILNFPVQTWAAVVMKEFHDLILRRLSKPVLSYLQVYDAANFDLPRLHVPALRSAISDAHAELVTVGMWHRLCAEHGTSVPLKYEFKLR